MPCAQPDWLVAAAVLLATDEFLRAQLRLAARLAAEAQSEENVIVRFVTDLAEVAGSG